MRILVTGGSGLIGRGVVDDLAAGGAEVIILSRRPELVLGLPAGARAVAWDASSPSGWAELADGALGIVHLAGEGIADGRWTEGRKRRLWDSRVRSTAAVVEAIRGATEPPRVLVQASAVGYYGGCGEEVVTERHPPGDDFLAELSLAWEEASTGVEELGVRRALLRTGIVLAAEGGALPKMALPFKLFAGGRLGDGRQYVPWIHLVDEVRAVRFLLEHDGLSGPFNLTAPHPVTNRELGRLLGRVLGRPSLLPTPAVALQLLLGEMSEALLHGQRAVPERLLDAGFTFRFPTLGPALEDLLR